MKKSKLLTILLTLVNIAIVLAFLAEILPRIVIHFNEDAYAGDVQIFAYNAYQQGISFFGGSAEPLFITGYKIKNLEVSDNLGKCELTTFYDDRIHLSLDYGLKATLQTYTLFGLPYKKIDFSCPSNGSTSWYK
ncbi:hypothetical protein KC614_02735 [candidate division WWE3 bacterium]|uniref:Uncharacterized protein n=1 Tax=candidate division WWE3 bacterium TaxID=2053526 RepID=A0A955RQW9_UNCKA|nr:hypothetical protein [candidate division WWE3 bacterium]